MVARDGDPHPSSYLLSPQLHVSDPGNCQLHTAVSSTTAVHALLGSWRGNHQEHVRMPVAHTDHYYFSSEEAGQTGWMSTAYVPRNGIAAQFCVFAVIIFANSLPSRCDDAVCAPVSATAFRGHDDHTHQARSVKDNQFTQRQQDQEELSCHWRIGLNRMRLLDQVTAAS